MAHDHVMYPSTLPAGCVMNVTRILRDRTMMEEKKDFALDAWNIIGYGQRILIGVPAGNEFSSMPVSAQMSGCEATVDQLRDCCRNCEAFMQENGILENSDGEKEALPSGFGAEAQAKALNPAIIALLIQWGPTLVQILKDLISKKQSAMEGPKNVE